MNWDKYYLEICNTVAKNSKCLSRQIGAILVRDKSIVSTGYCGPARGIPHCGKERYYHDYELRKAIGRFYPSDEEINTICPRQLLGYKSGEGLKWCISGHAERNALINAGREGIQTKGCKMFMSYCIPCTPCLIEIINAGIEEIIVTDRIYYDEMSKFLLENSHLKWRTYEL